MATDVIVITGATDGLGKALAVELSRQDGVRLILHGRNPERLARLSADLAGSAAEITTVRADLAEIAQVHGLADDIAARTDRISVLVNNAGVSSLDRRLTADGNELCFGVNHLAAFALTQRLLPLLQAGAPARVVHVASLGQAPIDFDDLTLSRGYDGGRAYSQSKLAMITAGMTLAERLDPAEVTVNSLHPATYMPTKMVMDTVGYSIDSLETGVQATLRLVRDPVLTGITGRFFDRTKETRAHRDAYLPQVRERLWAVSERLTAPATRAEDAAGAGKL